MLSEVCLSFAVRRRQIVACKLAGVELTFASKRELPVDLDAACTIVAAFAREMLERHQPVRVALEERPSDSERIHAFRSAIQAQARAAMAAVWLVPEGELYAAFAEPPLRLRHALRLELRDLVPVVTLHAALHPGVLDAAAIGLYVQVSAHLRRIETEGGLYV